MSLGVTTELKPISKPKKFIAELYKPTDFSPINSTNDARFEGSLNIFYFSVKEITDTNNYWLGWGGTFDNLTVDRLQVFFGSFFQEVFSEGDLVIFENSFWIDKNNEKVYINLTKYPWQFYDSKSAVYSAENTTFGTSPKNVDNPSDIIYGQSKVSPVMEFPSLQNKLNDVISGISTYSSFSIVADNSDGKYDGLDVIEFLNTPVQILKADFDSIDLNDFNIVRKGIVNDIKTNFDTIEIPSTDKFFLFNKDYCRKITISEFPNVPDGNLNKNIPVAWGTCFGLEPIEVGKDQLDNPLWIEYIVIDNNYITSVENVFDENQNAIDFSFDSATGIILLTGLDGDGNLIEAAYINATGKLKNSIGEIITFAINEIEGIPYVSGFWDTEETDYYINNSANVGFYYSSGITRDLINNVLKNDNAFLIQKNNGLLTLRQWGVNYNIWEIPEWSITQKPEKNFSDATKYFCSTVTVNYEKYQKDTRFNKTEINDDREQSTFKKHKKSYNAVFDTDILNKVDADNFSERILDRFSNVSETLSIGLGVDTFQINPLDKIKINILINNRLYSEYIEWIVTQSDPGQDTIIMESIS